VHDTLRANLNLTAPAPTSTTTAQTAPELQSTHPLESRLSNWRATQDSLKMSLLARQFGIAEPVRRGMERKIVEAGEWTPMAARTGLGNAGGVSADILAGRDAEIGWEDVFSGRELRGERDFHSEVEGRERMNW
jgi:proteasome maturation protein